MMFEKDTREDDGIEDACVACALQACVLRNEIPHSEHHVGIELPVAAESRGRSRNYSHKAAEQGGIWLEVRNIITRCGWKSEPQPQPQPQSRRSRSRRAGSGEVHQTNH